MKKTLQKSIVFIGGGLFVGLSLLNMQTYLALAEVAIGLVKFLPFGWWIQSQSLPLLLAVLGFVTFLVFRAKKTNYFLIAIQMIVVIALIVKAFQFAPMAISAFGVLMWSASTMAQTAPFWAKSFFFDSIRDVFRTHVDEAVLVSDSEATKTLTAKRNALPSEILSGLTIAALVANAIDIMLGIWQYPIMSWHDLFSFNFSVETVAADSVLKVLLLSVLPEVFLIITARLIYLSSIDTKTSSNKSAKRQDWGGNARPTGQQPSPQPRSPWGGQPSRPQEPTRSTQPRPSGFTNPWAKN
jgi:hypothetical protein